MIEDSILEDYFDKLKKDGFVIINNALSDNEINNAKQLFYNWKNCIEKLDNFNEKNNPHNIFKHYQVGHQEHAWYIRTRPQIINIFKKLWKTDNLNVSFDGCCYISEKCQKKDKIWTHTDQAPNKKGLQCYQSFVSLTENKEKTFVVYKNSHNLHESYFKEKNLYNSKNFNCIDKDYLNKINDLKCVLHVKPGDLVIWDSRTFHQNQYGNSSFEERIVQYLCYLPTLNIKNTKSQKNKRLLYFKNLRTTSHWPYPIHVNSLQPQCYGDKSKLINYNLLPKPNLEKYLEEIYKLI